MAGGFPDVVSQRIADQQATSQKVQEEIGIDSSFKRDVKLPTTSTNGETKSQFATSPPTPSPEPAPVHAPAPEAKEQVSVEIELGQEKEKVTEKKTIDLKDSSFFDKEIDKQTATADKKEDRTEGKSKENRAITEEKIDDKKLEPENDDYDFFAGILIEIVDLGTSTFFRWWAMDTSDAPYEMTKKKKDKLSHIVGEGLRRMNRKFPLVVLGLITLAIALYTPARKSNDMRNAKKAEKATEAKTETKKTDTKKTDTKKTDTKKEKKKPSGVTRPPGGTNK